MQDLTNSLTTFSIQELWHRFVELESRCAILEKRNAKLEKRNVELEQRNVELEKQSLDLKHRMNDLIEENQQLRDEIRRLKKQKRRPKIPPSNLEKRRGNEKGEGSTIKAGVHARVKKQEVIIHPESIPDGSRFKGYQEFHVQDLRIEVEQTTYKLAVYETPTGEVIHGRLPSDLHGKHFGPELIAFCLDQYHGRGVTQPELLKQLLEWGVEISSGELSDLLIKGKEDFHREKEDIFETGCANTDTLNVDDTAARHKGKNGYCTNICGPFFSYFKSTGSKSRINFLEILRGKYKDYILSCEALMYAFEQGISEKAQAILDANYEKRFRSEKSWKEFLEIHGISSKKDIRLATEAALLGSAIEHGLRPDTEILSDAAKQFDICILVNAFCWIHEERHYRKFIALTEEEKEWIVKIRSGIWGLYEKLKIYKKRPKKDLRQEIETSFDKLFGNKTGYQSIDNLLGNTFSRKEGLLQVLNYPWIALHNNDCERDIREYVKRRKISGSTRSELGRKARDTFTSLKKTCRKLGVCFWDYLRDRVGKYGRIPPLSELIIKKTRDHPV
jgi:hypothetical protein